MHKRILRFLSLVMMLLPGPVLAASAPLSSTDVQSYRTAFELVRQGKWDEARKTAARARDPQLAQVIHWLDFQEPGRGGTFSELHRFLEEHPDWPQRAALRREAERQMPRFLPPRVVIDWFKSEPPLTGPGATRLAEALTGLNQRSEAAQVVRRAWIELPFSPPEERQFIKEFGPYLHAVDHVQRLDRLLWQGDDAAARRMFTRVDAGTRALAEARIALQNMSSGVNAAVKKVPPVLQKDPGLVYERARWRRRKEQHLGAAELLDGPLPNAAFPEKIWPERDDAARRALARGDAALAYRIAKNHGIASGSAFADGEFMAGWIALRFLKQPKTALGHFELLYAGVSSPISAARGAYWSGRAAEAMDDQAKAQQWYGLAVRHPTTYYGQLAARRLGWQEAPAFPTPPAPAADTVAKFEERELVQIVRKLEQAEASDWARPFFLKLVSEGASAEELVLAAELAEELGRTDLALAAAKNARGKVDLVEHLFPVIPLPAGIGTERALLLSVMRQESAFDPGATSSAGARGLMQLMPATAKTVARQNGLSFSPDLLTRDPTYNIRLGSTYLQSLLDDYGGSYVLALASYNAGPSRVRQWMAENGDPRDSKVDAVDWVERIPFSETRNYVQRIMETLAIYRHRLGPDRLALTLEQDLKR